MFGSGLTPGERGGGGAGEIREAAARRRMVDGADADMRTILAGDGSRRRAGLAALLQWGEARRGGEWGGGGVGKGQGWGVAGRQKGCGKKFELEEFFSFHGILNSSLLYRKMLGVNFRVSNSDFF